MNNLSVVSEGSANVYADLGFADPDLELAKAELALQIVEIMSARQLSEYQAAAILGIDQPAVSDLFHGRLGTLSTECLQNYLVLASGQPSPPAPLPTAGEGRRPPAPSV